MHRVEGSHRTNLRCLVLQTHLPSTQIPRPSTPSRTSDDYPQELQERKWYRVEQFLDSPNLLYVSPLDTTRLHYIKHYISIDVCLKRVFESTVHHCRRHQKVSSQDGRYIYTYHTDSALWLSAIVLMNVIHSILTFELTCSRLCPDEFVTNGVIPFLFLEQACNAVKSPL